MYRIISRVLNPLGLNCSLLAKYLKNTKQFIMYIFLKSEFYLKSIMV